MNTNDIAKQTETCRKCKGTGRIDTVCDHGRCWNCDNGRAPTRAALKAQREIAAANANAAPQILEAAWQAAIVEHGTTDVATLRRIVNEQLEAEFQTTGNFAAGAAAIQALRYGTL